GSAVWERKNLNPRLDDPRKLFQWELTQNWYDLSMNTLAPNRFGLDKDGFVIGGGGGFKEEILMAEWAELYAFEKSLKIVWCLNITTVVFKTDSASLAAPMVPVVEAAPTCSYFSPL
ncbi:hypothetical protein Golob_014303, partial [Gossypium lobatum]|nr:hypothetical protein [Gossypium lobatum]